MKESSLSCFFHPRSIALVGVPRTLKAGSVFLLGLQDQGFTGAIYPVHPKVSELGGFKAYPRITEIPGPVDLVYILAPTDAVMDILEECATKRVQAVILYTSGFGETGEAKGRRAEERMLEIARRGGFRILGPNCMGIYSPGAGLAFFPGMPKAKGKGAFLSQSGSLANLFTGASASRRVFFKHVVSYGNGVDVDLPELLDYMAEDGDVELILSYCEGVRDGRALAAALDKLAGPKPVLVWKVGDTESGRQAAASHTGSLAGSGRIWSSLFRQFGVVELKNIEELLDTAMAFYHLGVNAGRRVVIVSGPGGPAVSAADAAEKAGLELAQLVETTVSRLREILPAFGTSLKNPIDVGLSASFELGQYLDSLRAIVADPSVDAVVLLGGGISRESNQEYVEGVIRIRRESKKPVLAVAYPGFITEPDLLAPFYEAGVPVYPTPERALSAYSRLCGYSDFRKRLDKPPS